MKFTLLVATMALVSGIKISEPKLITMSTSITITEPPRMHSPLPKTREMKTSVIRRLLIFGDLEFLDHQIMKLLTTTEQNKVFRYFLALRFSKLNNYLRLKHLIF